MKYFLVYSDIVTFNPDTCEATCTDEPKWLRDIIDGWKDTYKVGGRVCTTENNLQSFIVSPDDDLMSKCPDGSLLEMLPSDAQDFINNRIQPVYNSEIPPKLLQPTPTLEFLGKIYWGYAQNHSGTISVSEHWTIGNSPHHITGTITLSANVTVTYDAGISVYHDGDYRFVFSDGTGGIVAVGTSTSLINIASNASLSNTGTYADYTMIDTVGNSNVVTFEYCTVKNTNYWFKLSNTTGNTITIDHIYFSYSNSLFYLLTSCNLSVSVSNILFYGIFRPLTVASGVGAATITFNYCKLFNCSSLFFSTYPITLNCNYCYICSFSVSGSTQAAYNFTGCLFLEISGYTMNGGSTSNTSWTNSIMLRGFAFALNTGTTGTHAFNTCDLLGYLDAAIISNPTTAPVNIGMTSCYIAGNNSADSTNYFTGSQTPAQVSINDGSHFTFTTPKTTNNFNFTASSISSGSPSNTTATITWSVTFYTEHRVRYGIVSGTYTNTQHPTQSWSGWDGTKIMSTSASIPLAGLTAGTTYYYVVESWNWVTEGWVTSAENNFTTTGSASTGGGTKMSVVWM